MTVRSLLVVVICSVFAASAGAMDDARQATNHALIICGLPGDDEHRERFIQSVHQIRESLCNHFLFEEAQIGIQFGQWEEDAKTPAVTGQTGRATREEIAAEVRKLCNDASDRDTVWVFVVGHAYRRGGNTFLSIPHRDIDHREFARMFAPLAAKRAVFFICTPASGPCIRELSREGRIVVTATDSGRETNGSLFHSALAKSLAEIRPSPRHDVDEDGRISLLDLYLTATRNLVSMYQTENPPLIVTEHAALDDNADGRGSELQIDYLTVEQGGRSDRPETNGKKRKAFTDGVLAASLVLPFSPSLPADSESRPEDSGQAASAANQ